MKVLITGSNGLVGQYLVNNLLQIPDIEVIATGRGPNRLSNKTGYTYESLNLGSDGSVQNLVTRVQPDVIIHAAAMTQADECERSKESCWLTNVSATRSLVTAAEKVKSFFILLSTDFVFDGASGPYQETDPLNPVNYYGASKAAAERVVAQSSIDWAIVRTVLVYGIAEDSKRTNIVTWVSDNLKQGKRIRVVNDQFRTPTYVVDLVEACKLIIEKRAKGIFHISGKDTLTPYDMAYKVASILGLDVRLLEVSDSKTIKQLAQRPPKTGFQIDKAIQELGYAPHSFDEGIQAVLKQMGFKDASAL